MFVISLLFYHYFKFLINSIQQAVHGFYGKDLFGEAKSTYLRMMPKKLITTRHLKMF